MPQHAKSATELELGEEVRTPSGLTGVVRRILPAPAYPQGGTRPNISRRIVVAGERWLEEANGQSARRVPFVQTFREYELER